MNSKSVNMAKNKIEMYKHLASKETSVNVYNV